MSDHISERDFMLEWFGFGEYGRILGSPPKQPSRWFTDNPLDILKLVENAKREKLPAFCSVQPFSSYDVLYGIEKLFYDFDFGRKNQKLTEKQIEKRKQELAMEIQVFANALKKMGYEPLIVKTRKGYHVYIFLRSILLVDQQDFNFWRKVYKKLQLMFIPRPFKYLDSAPIGDLKRFSRVPFSIHEKSGEKCILVDERLRPTKIRSLNFYKNYGIPEITVKNVIEKTIREERKRKELIAKMRKERKEKWELEHGFVGKIRPCFEYFLETGEMCHQHRLALLLELWYSGYRTPEEMLEFCKKFNDYDEKKSLYQINWFLSHEIYKKMKPYSCRRLLEKGWCIYERCPIWRKRYKEANK